MGMTVADFDDMTFAEFDEAAKAWHEHREASEYAEWNRMRTLAAITVQPHCRKRITPKELLPLPTDKAAPQHHEVSREEARRRFERLVSARNEGVNAKSSALTATTTP